MRDAPELRGITWNHERGLDPLLATASLFEQQTGTRISWTARPLQAFADAPAPELAKRYDLLVLDHPHIGETAESEALIALDELLGADFIDDQARNSVGPSHRSYEWEGHQWALAIDAAGYVSAYRPDLLEQLGLGPPATWEDVFVLSERAQAQGMSIALPNQPVDTMTSLLTLIANSGTQPYAGECEIAERDLMLEKLSLLVRLSGVSPADAYGWNPIRLLDEMASTDALVYSPMLFGYSNYSRPGFRENLVRFAPVPSAGLGGIGGVIGGAGIAVSARCADLEAAGSYLEFVAGPEIQRTAYVDAAGQPGHRAAWLDPHANAITGDYFLDTLPGLDAGFLRPRYPGALLVQNQGGDLLHGFLRSGGEPQEILDVLDGLYRESLAADAH